MAVGRITWIVIALVVLAVFAYTVFRPPSVTQSAPACGSITSTLLDTTLHANVGPCTGNGLIIGGGNGIVFDCAGHTISGTGTGVGISLTRITMATVKNCRVTGFQFGFRLINSSGDVLSGNIANNNIFGIDVENSCNKNALSGNTADNNVYGFSISNSSNNVLNRNTANTNTKYGFYLSNSSNNVLDENTANTNTKYGFYLSNSSNTNALSLNTANGNLAGFYLANSFSNTLSTNMASSNVLSGFYLSNSSNTNALSLNTANGNEQCGLYLGNSFSNILASNTANNNVFGFCLSNSSNNTLVTNTANSNEAFGYSDDSYGSGTEGTANFYTGDICSGNAWYASGPSGICSPQF